MTWQGVPWAVDGATHPHEVARLLGYIAAAGGEGVVGIGDCAVVPLEVPGAGVRVMPGGVAILNRGTDTEGQLATQQTYVARNPDPDVVELAPTVGTTRYDLIAVVLEDPQYQGQPAPASVESGPYVRTAVYTNVGSTVETLEEVDPGQTGLALARVAWDASDGVVNAADITDLRRMVNPRIRTVQRLLNLPSDAGTDDLTSAGMVTFPSLATWADVEIPAWATRVQLEAHVAGVGLIDDGADGGTWAGKARVALGGITSQTTDLRPPDAKGTGKRSTFAYVCADDKPVPKAMRGTTVTLKAQAQRDSYTGLLKVRATWGTCVIVKATFIEDPDAGYWEA